MIAITPASNVDKDALFRHFSHYSDEEAIVKRVECYLTHNKTLVAKDGDLVVGVVQWQIKEDPCQGVAELEEIFVLESHRNQGIGLQLVQKAVEEICHQFESMGIKPRRIFLFVSESNETARRLYEAAGFSCQAKVGDIFQDNTNELLYLFTFSLS